MKKQYICMIGIALTAINLYAQNRPSITIVNNTGYTVYYLYISQSTATEWEEDILGDAVISNGDSINVRLAEPLTTANRYDIKLVDIDGDSYTKWNVLIHEKSRIIFSLDDIDTEDFELTARMPSVTIVNNTGYTVYYLYISQSTATEWEEDILGDAVISNGDSINVRLAEPLTTANRYDIKLTDEDGDTYTKWNLLIQEDAQIVFTLDDIDG
ncbi:hypothetical protein PilKf_02337 [Pillotina sp. SPG140]